MRRGLKRAVGLYRSPSYSPSQHLQNDRAILDAVLERLGAAGWLVARATESDVADGRLPEGDLYLNMCQGSAASHRLQRILPAGTPCINTPDAVLACHRHRLVPLLQAREVPFPHTVLLSSTGSEAAAPPVHLVTDNGHPVWIKRGDVHAQTAEDVLAVPVAEVASAVSRFAGRGIGRVALQAHVVGPVIKFYGVIGREFFHWYRADGGTLPDNLDLERLQELAEHAARAAGLAVYGGDAVLAAPDEPVLIDLNDWPSFAPVRSVAARAIARYAHRNLPSGYSCSTP